MNTKKKTGKKPVKQPKQAIPYEKATANEALDSESETINRDKFEGEFDDLDLDGGDVDPMSEDFLTR